MPDNKTRPWWKPTGPPMPGSSNWQTSPFGDWLYRSTFGKQQNKKESQIAPPSVDPLLEAVKNQALVMLKQVLESYKSKGLLSFEQTDASFRNTIADITNAQTIKDVFNSLPFKDEITDSYTNPITGVRELRFKPQEEWMIRQSKDKQALTNWLDQTNQNAFNQWIEDNPNLTQTTPDWLGSSLMRQGSPDNESAYEEYRQALLAHEPNQFKQWEIQNKPNPYTRPDRSYYESAMDAAQKAGDEASYWSGLAEGMPSNEYAYGTYTSGGLQGMAQQAADIARQKQQEYLGQAQQLVQGVNGKMGQLAYGYQPEPASGPPTPEWLPQFVPGARVGAPLGKTGKVVTPSGQQWNAALPSVRQGLADYASWSGGRPFQDIMAEAQNMLPDNPWNSRSRWNPMRQRI